MHPNRPMARLEVAPDREQSRALEILGGARSLLLVGHERPDGDVLGSQAALARVLSGLGKEVRILNPDPPEETFGFLEPPGGFGAWEGEELPFHQVAVLLDISELGRTGPLAAPLAAYPSRKLVVDHHLHGGPHWWDAAYRDPAAAATGVLVWRIARALDAPIDAPAAQALLTALTTDTGWFRHSNTDAESLQIAADLVELGAEPAQLYGALFQRRPAELPGALADMLTRVEYHLEGALAFVALPRSAGIPAELAEGDLLLDLLRSIAPVRMVLLLREQERELWRLSGRSKGDVDVHDVAAAFGGGGHAKAAGARLVGDLSTLRRRLLEEAARAFARTGA